MHLEEFLIKNLSLRLSRSNAGCIKKRKNFVKFHLKFGESCFYTKQYIV